MSLFAILWQAQKEKTSKKDTVFIQTTRRDTIFIQNENSDLTLLQNEIKALKAATIALQNTQTTHTAHDIAVDNTLQQICEKGCANLSFPNTSLQNTQLSVFPNPSNGAVNLKYELPTNTKTAQIQIFTADAKRLFHRDITAATGEWTIDGGALPEGQYYAHIMADGRILTAIPFQIIP
jgi:hypothetical protein